MSQGANFATTGVVAGYRGIADIDGELIRFADANITVRQEIQADDLVMGDWDRNAYVYGKMEIGGTISGPVTEGFLSGANSVIQWACGRFDTPSGGSTTPCGGMDVRDIHLYYYCDRDRLFENLFVNSFSFSVAAGEVAQFSLDVIGSAVDGVTQGWGTTSPPHVTTAEKLLTWDKVNVSITKSTGDAEENDIPEQSVLDDIAYSNFEFTVNNNVETVYGLGQPNLLPFDIVPGLRHISGTISVYGTPDFNGAFTFEDYCAENPHEIEFGLSSICAGGTGTTVKLFVRFHRIEPTLSTSTIISTVGFTGVTHQSGYPWDLSATP